jgi:hypothetical protein
MSGEDIVSNSVDSSKAIGFDAILTDSALRSLSPCCRKTIQSHVSHNPMMVCPDCKLMIKCFNDEKSFNNYVIFCKSRSRRIKTEVENGFYFVMYNSFPGSGN